jgi:CheY-like chemotaxis protein
MLHILVVEDRSDEALPLCCLLLRAGHRVNVAADGIAALQSEIADPPDVILLDLCLKKLDGFEVAAATRSVAWSRRPYIVAVTGHNDDEHRRRAKAAGIDHFLVKPVNIEELKAILQKVAPHRKLPVARP